MERLHGERFQSIRQAKDEVLAWLLWYNRQRMHSTLNYLSPVEFESRRENGDARAAASRHQAGGGNASELKAWKNDETVFPPFPLTLEIDKADFHIPTATTTTRGINLSKPAR